MPSTSEPFDSEDIKTVDVSVVDKANDDQIACVSFSWWIALLLVIFGVSSWVAINGLWMELPLLVNVLPEGWNLPAYLSILIQLANVGPLVYVLLTRVCRTRGRGNGCGTLMWLIQPPERLANYSILIVGLIASLLLTRFWSAVVVMPGLPANVVWENATPTALYKHSLGLFLLTFALGMVDCMSSVTFLAYLANMPAVYAGALLFGETASGLLPSLFALGQGVTSEPTCVPITPGNLTGGLQPVYSEPRFSVSVFMGLISATTLLSLLAFSLLDTLPTGLGKSVTLSYRNHHSLPSSDPREEETFDTAKTLSDAGGDHVTLHADESIVSVPVDKQNMLFRICFLLTCYASCLSNGLLPSLQSFSTAAYGTLTYHLAVTLSGITAPTVALFVTSIYGYEQLGLCVRSLFTFCCSGRRALKETTETDVETRGNSHFVSAMASVQGNRLTTILILLGVLASIPSVYILYLASASPTPPQLGGAGPTAAVFAWVLMTAAFNVQKTWITLHLVQFGSQRNLRMLGVATQTGSLVGALISFLLTATFNLFKSKVPCV